jgi:hypothetical protein
MKTLLIILIAFSLTACCKKNPKDCIKGNIISVGGCDKGGECGILIQTPNGKIFKAKKYYPVVGETYKSWDCK